MKGIVLAGGTGSRLWPITRSVSKQLLPVYDKPMIYYPLSTLMLAGIREILIITTPKDQAQFKGLLGDGSKFGVSFEYEVQLEPKGISEAFILGRTFLAGDSCLLILGDNIFHGAGLGQELQRSLPAHGAHIFTYAVANPEQYGVLSVSEEGTPLSIVEKPLETKSNLAITGLYFFDARVSNFAEQVQPSARGELEITSLLQMYLSLEELTVTSLSRGTAWLDTGTIESLQNASTYIRVIEQRTGLKIGCLEEIAHSMKWINDEKLRQQALTMNNEYGEYLLRVTGNQIGQ
jgi:glucose-1-phosphate thymidylyltransferase